MSGAHYNPYFWLLATGKVRHRSCYQNLIEAIQAFGLDEGHVHDNLNLFQKTAQHVNGASINL